jgi:hypothetical protein
MDKIKLMLPASLPIVPNSVLMNFFRPEGGELNPKGIKIGVNIHPHYIWGL